MATINGICTGGFGRSCDGRYDNCVRYRQRRGAVEEAALVNDSIPGEFFVGQNLLIGMPLT